MGRLSGHALISEGAPHDDDGARVMRNWQGTSGPGRARCQCGALSGVLPSAGAWRRWHIQHKAAMLESIYRANRQPSRVTHRPFSDPSLGGAAACEVCGDRWPCSAAGRK